MVVDDLWYARYAMVSSTMILHKLRRPYFPVEVNFPIDDPTSYSCRGQGYLLTHNVARFQMSFLWKKNFM